MTDYNEIFKINPYSLSKDEKHEFLTKNLKYLTEHHYNKCYEYKKIIDSRDIKISNIKSYYEIPFLPVRLFKEFQLKSINIDEVAKTMTSSGTTGQEVSKIYIDKYTASNQTKVLSKIVSNFIGDKRLPMIILDTSTVIKDRIMFSARGAGILGFQIFSYDRIYALDENMNLNTEILKGFLEKYKGKDILLFGFTFIIWKHFLEKLKKCDIDIDLSNGILIHGGGWKKLINQSVTPEEFKNSLNEVCGINKIYDYYGMVEQTGSIYMECEYGHLHSSIFSDIIIRNPADFSVASVGEKGIIQVLSILPKSYPGHSLLTEDEGILLGEDDCLCGRLGKYFRILGRLKNAEIRGCSDTYADKFK